MTALVYRVSCASRGDQWFGEVVQAEAAARELLHGGDSVNIQPVAVPQSPEAFLAFLLSYRPRVSVTFGGEGVSEDPEGKYGLKPGWVLLADSTPALDPAHTLKDALTQVYGFIPGARR